MTMINPNDQTPRRALPFEDIEPIPGGPHSVTGTALPPGRILFGTTAVNISGVGCCWVFFWFGPGQFQF